MCQATGYKLKSNKELPSPYQVFSKLIPMSTFENGSDKPNGNQLYPMFSVIEFEHDKPRNVIAINVKLCRVGGIFQTDGKDIFTQTSYGLGEPTIKYLIEVDGSKREGDDMSKMEYIEAVTGKNVDEEYYMYGVWVSENEYDSLGEGGYNKYLYIQY
jgi:hypothetical protein